MTDAPRSHAHRTARPLVVALVAAAFYFAACGSEDATADASTQPEAGVALNAPADAHGVAGSTDDRIEIDVTGPAFAGKHEVPGPIECLVTAGIWTVGIEREVRKGVSSLNLILAGVPASGGSTDQASMALIFGQVTDEIDSNAGLIELHAKAHGGDATGSVTREGRGAVLRIQGVARGAGRVTATIRCATVTVTT